MWRWLSAFALFLALAPQGASGGEPDIHTTTPEIDFGVVLEGENRTRTAEIENRGDDDLRVLRVHPSCGCTIAKILDPQGNEVEAHKGGLIGVEPLLILKPGERAQIEVTYRSLGQPHQKITKRLDVFSDDPDTERLRIALKVEVKKAYTLEPRVLRLGKVMRGATSEARVVLTPEPGVDIQVVGVRPTPGLEAELHPRPMEDGRTEYVVDVRVHADGPVGPFSRTLGLITNHSEFLAVKVPVFADIEPVVRFDTGNEFNSQLLDFGMLDPDVSHEKTVEVINRRPEVPFHIRKIVIDSPQKEALSATLETVQEGVHYRIRVATRAKYRGRFFKGKLIVHSDHPEQPLTNVFVAGWFKKP